MSPAARADTAAVFWLSVAGLCIFGFTTAERAVAHAYRRLRFHCGRVRAEVAPLTPKEAMALVDIRRNYRDSAEEPAFWPWQVDQ